MKINYDDFKPFWNAMHEAASKLELKGVDFGDMTDEEVTCSCTHSKTKTAWMQFKEAFQVMSAYVLTEINVDQKIADDATIAHAFKKGMPMAFVCSSILIFGLCLMHRIGK